MLYLFARLLLHIIISYHFLRVSPLEFRSGRWSKLTELRDATFCLLTYTWFSEGKKKNTVHGMIYNI